MSIADVTSIIATLIIVILLIAGTLIYLNRQRRKFEEEKRESERRHELEILELRRQRGQELQRIQNEYKIEEREEQLVALEKEKNRAKANTFNEFVEAYRQELASDTFVTRLQILDMDKSLEVSQLYIQLRVNQEVTSSDKVDPTLRAAEKQQDPGELLRVGNTLLERRVSRALDPDEAIARYRHCIVVGNPGAGKSTLLKYLTLKAAKRQLQKLPDLPILIELNEFANSGYDNLLEFATSRWENRYKFSKEDRYRFSQMEVLEHIKESFSKGKALLLLDALDETLIGSTNTKASDSYERVVKAIEQFAADHAKAFIVITTRKAAYHQHGPQLRGFRELEILEFRQEDIRQFVNKWFSQETHPAKQQSADRLIAALEENQRLRSLAANPLLLSLITIAYEERSELPKRRAALYEQCVDILLKRWDATRYIRRRREFLPQHVHGLLQEIAWYFHKRGMIYFPKSGLLRVIGEFLPRVGLPSENNGRILAELESEYGLIKEQAIGWYSFLHITLQEYFVARYIITYDELNVLLEHRGEPWWEEIILFYAGDTPDASFLLQKLLDRSSRAGLQEDIFYTNIILAGHCLAAYPTIRVTSLREETISGLFAILKETQYALAKEQISETLAEIGGYDVNSKMLSLLRNSGGDDSVPDAILNAMGQYRDTSLVPSLLSLLQNTSLKTLIRKHIAQVLGKLGDSSIARYLLSLLDTTLDIEIRCNIANTLGQLKNASIVPDLLSLLQDIKLDISLREQIARALGQSGDTSVAPKLKALLLNTQLDVSLRGEAAIALGQLGDTSAIEDLLALLRDTNLDSSLHMNVSDALGELGSHSASPIDSDLINSELLHLLKEKWPGISAREHLAKALSQLKNASIVPDLLSMLQDTHLEDSVRSSIARALGEIGDHSIARELLALLQDTRLDISVRENITDALGKLKEPLVVPAMLSLLQDASTPLPLRGHIADALGELGERSIAANLVLLLKKSNLDRSTSKSIVDALGKLSDKPEHVRELAKYSRSLDIDDSVYKALWLISRRARVWVYEGDRVEPMRTNMDQEGW